VFYNNRFTNYCALFCEGDAPPIANPGQPLHNIRLMQGIAFFNSKV